MSAAAKAAANNSDNSFLTLFMYETSLDLCCERCPVQIS